ncbi:MAG: hypothetical protein KC461_08260 [Dehalococcoidia bacterium]|nr:hypothetical protein [Dehalococcoidia bacterium]
MSSEDHPNAGSDRDPRRAARDEQLGEGAERVGRMLGRFARKARATGEELAREARPEAERLARQARIAADAARPHLERAGREAVKYAREHEDEIKRAARTGAEFTARRAIPLPLRPIVDAVEQDRRRRPPLRDDRAPDDPPATGA